MARKDKNQGRNKVIITIIISIFLISSVASIVIFYDPGTQSQNVFTQTISGKNYKFERLQDQLGNLFYQVSSDKSAFSAYNLPVQLAYIEITSEAKSKLISSPFMYLTFHPDDPQISFLEYIRFDLRNSFPQDRFFLEGILEESSIYNLPIITCENATLNSPVVVLASNNKTSINNINDCIFVNIAEHEVIQARDLLTYLSQGIDIG